MRRAKRLFQIMQLLRRDRGSTITQLAAELKVTKGTLYRDVAYLLAVGVPIECETGAGYRLPQPSSLPPEIA
jgi:predicted DNA-binding transcriptional regulator YafY